MDLVWTGTHWEDGGQRISQATITVQRDLWIDALADELGILALAHLATPEDVVKEAVKSISLFQDLVPIPGDPWPALATADGSYSFEEFPKKKIDALAEAFLGRSASMIIEAYGMGAGGTDRIDDKGWATVKARIEKVQGYAQGFLAAIRNGNLSLAQIVARARLYAGETAGPFEEGKAQQVGIELPAHPGDHCDGRTRCRCWWEVKTVDTGVEAYWHAEMDRDTCGWCAGNHTRWWPYHVDASMVGRHPDDVPLDLQARPAEQPEVLDPSLHPSPQELLNQTGDEPWNQPFPTGKDLTPESFAAYFKTVYGVDVGTTTLPSLKAWIEETGDQEAAADMMTQIMAGYRTAAADGAPLIGIRLLDDTTGSFPIGQYRPNGTGGQASEIVVNINSKGGFWDADDLANLNAAMGFNLEGSRADVLVHEMGHALHLQQFGDGVSQQAWANAHGKWPTGKDAGLDFDPETVALSLSRYGGANPLEFVAEAYVKMVHGETLDERQTALYHYLQGPITPSTAKALGITPPLKVAPPPLSPSREDFEGWLDDHNVNGDTIEDGLTKWAKVAQKLYPAKTAEDMAAGVREHIQNGFAYALSQGLKPDAVNQIVFNDYYGFGSDGAAAGFEPIDRVLTIYTTTDQDGFTKWTSDLSYREYMTGGDVGSSGDANWLSNPTLDGAVIHELGHASHLQNYLANKTDRTAEDFLALASTDMHDWFTRDDDDVAAIGASVSHYAGTMVGEFVAEVYSGTAAKKQYASKVYDLYESMGGMMTPDIIAARERAATGKAPSTPVPTIGLNLDEPIKPVPKELTVDRINHYLQDELGDRNGFVELRDITFWAKDQAAATGRSVDDLMHQGLGNIAQAAHYAATQGVVMPHTIIVSHSNTVGAHVGEQEVSELYGEFSPQADEITIHMSPTNGPAWADPAKMEESMGHGWNSWATAEGVVQHEFGHKAHYDNVIAHPEFQDAYNSYHKGHPAEVTLDNGQAAYTVDPKDIAAGVSRYAMANPHEFVAEVWAGVASGKSDFNAQVFDLYRAYGGYLSPDVQAAAAKARKKTDDFFNTPLPAPAPPGPPSRDDPPRVPAKLDLNTVVDYVNQLGTNTSEIGLNDIEKLAAKAKDFGSTPEQVRENIYGAIAQAWRYGYTTGMHMPDALVANGESTSSTNMALTDFLSFTVELDFSPGMTDKLWGNDSAYQQEMGHGWSSSPSMTGTIVHELGHIAHGNNYLASLPKGSGGFDKRWHDMDKFGGTVSLDGGQVQPELVAAKVSRYATTNPKEFVAEVFAGAEDGRRYPPEVYDLYIHYGGFVTPDIRRHQDAALHPETPQRSEEPRAPVHPTDEELTDYLHRIGVTKTRTDIIDGWAHEAAKGPTQTPASVIEDNLARDAREQVGKAFEWMHGQGAPMPVLIMASEREDPDVQGGVAFYNAKDDSITLQMGENNRDMWRNDLAFESTMGSGWTANPTRAGAIIHELGHEAHVKAWIGPNNPHPERLTDEDMRGAFGLVMGLPFGKSDNIDGAGNAIEIAAGVSHYAATNPAEFVAEVIAGTAAGRQYDARVYRMYDQMYGPKLPAIEAARSAAAHGAPATVLRDIAPPPVKPVPDFHKASVGIADQQTRHDFDTNGFMGFMHDLGVDQVLPEGVAAWATRRAMGSVDVSAAKGNFDKEREMVDKAANDTIETLFQQAAEGIKRAVDDGIAPPTHFRFADGSGDTIMGEYRPNHNKKDGNQPEIIGYLNDMAASEKESHYQYDSGWQAARDPSFIFTHEMGHKGQQDRLEAEGLKEGASDKDFWKTYADWDGAITDKTERALSMDTARRVSRYALGNPAEFVAEVYSGTMFGNIYDDATYRLYDKLKGKITPSIAKAWKSAKEGSFRIQTFDQEAEAA